MLQDAVHAFAALRRAAYLGLGSAMAETAASPSAVLPAVVFAFAVGLLHAMTPGHGKATVFAYLIGHDGKPWRGMLLGLKVAIVHVVSGVAVFLIVRHVLEWATDSTIQDFPGIRTASYLLVSAAGACLLARAVYRRSSNATDHPTHRDRRLGGALSFAVGLLPCPLTVLVLTYAVANGTLAAGLALTAVMALGIATTIGLVGSLAIVLRAGIVGVAGDRLGRYDAILRWLEILSAGTVLVFGVSMLGGAFAPVPRNPFGP